MVDTKNLVVVDVNCDRCASSFKVPSSVVAESQDLMQEGCPGSEYECMASYYATLIDRKTLKSLEEACCDVIADDIIDDAQTTTRGELKMEKNPTDRLR